MIQLAASLDTRIMTHEIRKMIMVRESGQEGIATTSNNEVGRTVRPLAVVVSNSRRWY